MRRGLSIGRGKRDACVFSLPVRRWLDCKDSHSTILACHLSSSRACPPKPSFRLRLIDHSSRVKVRRDGGDLLRRGCRVSGGEVHIRRRKSQNFDGDVPCVTLELWGSACYSPASHRRLAAGQPLRGATPAYGTTTSGAVITTLSPSAAECLPNIPFEAAPEPASRLFPPARK